MPSEREENLLRENDAFILREACKASGKIVTRSDEEYSVALAAFWEAIRTHDPEKGSLQAYGAVVIRHRLVDWYRSQRKYAPETAVEPAVFGGETVEGAEGIQQAVEQAQLMNQPQTDLTEEIRALSQELNRYGISFFDLPDQCPKAAKTRRVCKKAARFLAFAELLLAKLRKTLKLPAAEMETGVPIARKLLDKFRKYIIASTEILAGDFPGLQEYFEGEGDA